MPGAAPRVVIAQSVKALAAFAIATAVLVQPAQAKRAGAPTWGLALDGPAKASYVSAAAFGAWQAAGIRMIVTTRSTWSSADHARLASLAARYKLRLVEPIAAPKTAAGRAALRKACTAPRSRIDSCAVAAADAAGWSAWRKLGQVDFVIVQVASPRAIAGFAHPLPGGTRLIALSPLPSASSKATWTSAAGQASASSAVLGTSVGAQSASAGLGLYLQVVRAAGTKTAAGVDAPDTKPPSIPSGLVAQAVTATSATVAWSPSTDASGVSSYAVSLSSNAYATAAGTTYTVNGLACSTTYTVGVAAVDGAGNTSAEATLDVKTSACATGGGDRKSTRLNSSHERLSRMPSSA